MGSDSPVFGDLLRRFRVAAGLTQEELAERAGISTRAISDLERGLYKAPRRDTAQLLEGALELNEEERKRLDATIVRTRSTQAPSDSTTRPHHNLPPQPTPFIGRGRDIERVRAL